MILISAQAFPPKPGGIQYLLAGTAEHIAKSGYDVTVFADGGNEAKSWDQEQDTSYDVERFSGFKPLRRRQKASRIKSFYKRGDAQALYADSWKSLEYAEKSDNVPIVVWAHGNEFPLDGAKKGRISKALQKADHILFNSKETQRRAKQFCSAKTASSIVHPPLNEPVPASREDKLAIDELWREHHPKLVCLCRLVEWKGVDRSIGAMPAILKEHPKALLVIAGVGNDRTRLEKLADELDVRENVVFIGWIEGGRKTAFLNSADLYIQPGRTVNGEEEGYGISYVEAALHGLPSISGNVGGAPEAVIHGETGLVVDANHQKNVTTATLSILADQSRLQEYKNAARAHGQSCLWQNQIGRVLGAAGIKPREQVGS